MKLWYYFNNFLPEPGILTRFYSEMVKVKNSAKNVFNWRVNISWTTSSKTYKFWGILWREINNSLLEFGILTTFGSKMVSVRKSIKNDFNWRVNISQTATVKTSKFWAIICLEFVHDLRTEVHKKCPNFSTLRMSTLDLIHSVWKVSKYGVNSGPYFPVFRLNTEIYRVNLRIQSETGKYGPEMTPYLDTFHAVPRKDKTQFKSNISETTDTRKVKFLG